VQADELQALGGDDIAALTAARGRERGRIFREGERGDFNAGVAGLPDGAARIGEGEFSKTSLQMAWRRRGMKLLL